MVEQLTLNQFQTQMNRFPKIVSLIFITSILLTACTQPAPLPTEQVHPTPALSPIETNLIPTEATSPTEEPDFADIIFYDGAILTMELDQPLAQAIAIQGNRIMAVGLDSEILTRRGRNTQVIDLLGMTIMPGIVDAHDHIFDNADNMGMTFFQTQQMALENGITTVADMYTTAEFLDEMQAFQQAGELRIRTSLYLSYTTNCGEVLGDWYKEIPPTRVEGEMLRIGGVKIFADGGTCGKAALSTGYPAGGHGDLFFSQDEINQMVADIQDAGYQVAIHAQGDLAIEQAQNAIENTLEGGPNVLRHRIEHNPFARPDLLSRYSEIGIVPIAWGEYPTCAEINNAYYSSYFGLEPMPWLEDWRAFLDANPDLPVAWHSDWPYASINPFLHLYSYVTRQQVDEDGTVCFPPAWLAAHAITVEEALPMMTINTGLRALSGRRIG